MSNDLYKQAENKKAVLKIHFDSDVQSPRNEMDNLGTMVCWHRRYSLGDEHNHAYPRDFFISLLEEMGFTEEYYDHMSDSGKPREYFLSVLERKYVILPIYGYDHGDLTVRTEPFSCPWDSRQLGWIYVSKEKIRKEYGVKRVTKEIRETVLSVLRGEVATYDLYLRGEVFGFVIEDIEGNVIDSCWGFYGSDLMKNGIKDHIAEEYADLLAEVA